MKLQHVEISWAKALIELGSYFTSEHQYLRRKGFYAVLSAMPVRIEGIRRLAIRDLLYIGQAFDQAIRDRINQEHSASACIEEYHRKNPKLELLLKVGVITRTNQQTLTQELFNDVECGLIYSNQPICNIQCKKTYQGRSLFIINKGDYDPLHGNSLCIPSP
jgi:hypothetical protein